MGIKMEKYYLISSSIMGEGGNELNLTPKNFIGKCIGFSTSMNTPLIEFIEFIDGHGGTTCVHIGRKGKEGHCWFVEREFIVREVTYKEAVISSL